MTNTDTVEFAGKVTFITGAGGRSASELHDSCTGLGGV